MTGNRYVVTGGGGFVGKGICRALRARGDEVLSLSRSFYPELNEIGVSSIQVDLGSRDLVLTPSFRGFDGVFHTAAKVDMWGQREDFVRSNVVATNNVIKACREAGVGRLVFTSSPSVVHTGRDLLGVNESQPIPEHFEALYPETKAAAEMAVLRADSSNESGTLRSVSLRPHLIWGPGDTNLIPSVLKRARAGKLVRIGSGTNIVDLTFIEDCVTAHLLAMDALKSNPDQVGGKAYFITQGDPISLWGWIDKVLVAHGLPRVRKSVSLKTAMKVARILETASKALRVVGVNKPPILTRFLVSEMATSHYFDITAARRDLNYHPSCTVEEALSKTFADK